MIKLGWQKIDLTQTVREWYERRLPSEKLRLLVDCTGCGKRYFLHLLDQPLKLLKQRHQYFPWNRNDLMAGWTPKRNSVRYDNIIQPPVDTGRRVAKSIAVAYHSILNCSLHTNLTPLFKNYRLKNIKTQLPQQRSIEKKIYQHGANRLQLEFERNLVHRLILKEEESQIFKTQNNIHLKGRNSDPNPHRPFLVLKTEMKRQKRTRRRVVDCVGAMYGQCCKESFYVSFKALGWDDWIIAPRGYFANYCRGECGGPFRTPDTFQTFHAHFIEEYRKMGLLNGMQPCCAPVKFSSMSLIYYGVDGIIKRDLPKMVVDECGCP